MTSKRRWQRWPIRFPAGGDATNQDAPPDGRDPGHGHASLRNALCGLDAGSGGVLLLKETEHADVQTAITRFVELMRSEGRVLFHARAEPAQRPFDLVLRAFADSADPGVDSLAAACDALVSERTGHSLLPRELVAEFRVVSQALGLLELRAAEAPVAVVLENMQCADSASVAFATRLLTYAEQLPILFVATLGWVSPSARLLEFLQAAPAG